MNLHDRLFGAKQRTECPGRRDISDHNFGRGNFAPCHERRLLAGGLVGLAFLCMARPLMSRSLGLRPGHRKYPTDETNLAAFTGLFRNLDASREIGNRYLAKYPRDANRFKLLKMLVGAERIRSPRQLRHLLAAKRASDFQNGRVVIIDGWLLARSEVRACAIVSLAPNKKA